MLEIAVIALRWLQYSGAVVLLGAPLFLLYNLRNVDGTHLTWVRPVLTVAALIVALGALAALVAQTAVMAGSLHEAVKPASLSLMVSGTALGRTMLVRAAVAVLALAAVLVLKPGRGLFILMVVSGSVVAASFAWTGHAGATEGAGGLVHLASDIVHAAAAALWLGALTALTILLVRRAGPDEAAIHRSLRDFAGLGTLAVGLLALTGLANSWFLVGPARVGDLGASLYGQLLIAKFVLFALMLALAADNRFRLAPALGSVLADGADSRRALRRLQRSVAAEALVGGVLLAVVAVIGTLVPPSAI